MRMSRRTNLVIFTTGVSPDLVQLLRKIIVTKSAAKRLAHHCKRSLTVHDPQLTRN